MTRAVESPYSPTSTERPKTLKVNSERFMGGCIRSLQRGAVAELQLTRRPLSGLDQVAVAAGARPQLPTNSTTQSRPGGPDSR